MWNIEYGEQIFRFGFGFGIKKRNEELLLAIFL
jgi:hypothetical protein